MGLFGKIVRGVVGRKRGLRFSGGKNNKMVAVDELDESHRRHHHHHRVTAAVGDDAAVDLLHASATTTTAATLFELGGGGGSGEDEDESSELSSGGKQSEQVAEQQQGTELQVPLRDDSLPLRHKQRPRLSMRTISSEEADDDDSDGSDVNLDELLSAAAAAAEGASASTFRTHIPLTTGTDSTRRFVVDEEGHEIKPLADRDRKQQQGEKEEEEEIVTADSTKISSRSESTSSSNNSPISDEYTNLYGKVRFGTVTVHYHQLCLGDNPSVHRGVPVALSNHQVAVESFTSLKDYETTVRQSKINAANTYSNKPRILQKTDSHIDTVSSEECPKLDSLQRVRLLKNAGYSGQELQTASKQFEKIRQQRMASRRKQHLKLKQAESAHQRQSLHQGSEQEEEDDDDGSKTHFRPSSSSDKKVPPTLTMKDDFDILLATMWRSFANLTYRRGVKRRERELLAPYLHNKDNKDKTSRPAEADIGMVPPSTTCITTTPMAVAVAAAGTPVKGGVGWSNHRNSFFSMHRSSSSSFMFNKGSRDGGGGSSSAMVINQDGSNTSTATTLSTSTTTSSPSQSTSTAATPSQKKSMSVRRSRPSILKHENKNMLRTMMMNGCSTTTTNTNTNTPAAAAAAAAPVMMQTVNEH